MAKATVPKIAGDGERRGVWATMVAEEWVQLSGAIGSHEHCLGGEVLHREAKGIKFNEARIITSESTSANKVGDNVGGDKNIIKVERAGSEVGGASGDYRKTGTIANDNMLRIRL